ncbi:hypothetical protein FQA39_LY07785 [Lamprigera yunnana]|nr:hypothetical protein FQA39_LY07785 [Lamprigera yunnana]
MHTWLLQIFVFANFFILVFSICEPFSRYRAYGLDANQTSYYPVFFNSSLISDCGCDGKYTCVRKCCDEDYVIDEDSVKCVYNKSFHMSIPVYKFGNVIIDNDNVDFRYVSGVNECLLDEDLDNSYTVGLDEFYIQRDGKLWLPHVNTYFKQEHYCIEYDDDKGPMAILCVLKYNLQALDISERLTITGTYRFRYVFKNSTSVGYHNFLANSGSKVLAANKKRIEFKRFVWYSVYAWSVPLLLMIIVQTFSEILKPNKWYNPGVTDKNCWLNSGIPTFIYLYLPMAIVVVTNIVLFSITAYRIRKVQKDTEVLRTGGNRSSNTSDDKSRFGVYVKLFLAMGVNWSMEIITWAIDWQVENVPAAVWYVTDFCNAAFGVVIFIIFVCNKKIWKLMKLNLINSTSNFCIFDSENQYDREVGRNLSAYAPRIFNKTYLNDCDCDSNYICIRKCCDVHYVEINKTCTLNKSLKLNMPVFQYGNVQLEDEELVGVRIVSGINQCILDDNMFYEALRDEFYVQKDGRIWLPAMNTYFGQEHYCLDYNGENTIVAIICILSFDIQGLLISERLTVVGMIISLPFLFITFIVYALLPFRNQHGRCLMCYVFSLFHSQLMNVITTLHPHPDNYSAYVCRSIAMICLFFTLASVLWANVMSIDIYLTFSGSRGFHGSKRRTDRRRFIIYSIYAWGCPLILVILVMVLSSVVKPNKWYNPGIADQECWLNDGIPSLLYLYLPMSIVAIVNITLFAITASKIRQSQKDTAVLRKGKNKKNEDDKVRFAVYLKLFSVMGVNWTMDIIAWAVDWQVDRIPRAIWYVTEFCNAAFGLVIFLIFVCKKNIWNLLKRRYNAILGIPNTNVPGLEIELQNGCETKS